MRRGISTLAVATCICSTNSAVGQAFRPATVTEQYLTGSNTKLVHNTGCGQSSDGSDLMQVLTWDGAKPSFGWSFNGTSTGFQALEAVAQGLTVTDPDIVSSFTNGKYFMVAVYLVQGTSATQVEYEEQAYDPSTNSWVVVTPPTQIDNNLGLNCTSPNVDIDRISGDAVMVFQEGSSIYARALNLTSSTLFNNALVASSTRTLLHRQPDVAIYEDPSGTFPIIVSVTYITENVGSGTLEVDLAQDKLPNVQAASSFPTPLVTFNPVPSNRILEFPRIAAPMFPPGNISRYDCMTVVRYNSGSGDQILTLTIASGSLVLPHAVINAPLTSSYSGANARPVVTYIGDGAFVAWQYDDTNFAKLHKNVDVLGFWVQLNGTRATSFGNDLLVANAHFAGFQGIPSIEARNGTNAIGSTGVAMWFDEDKSDIAYKPINWFSANLRPAANGGSISQNLTPDKQLTVYPSPAVAGAHVAMRLTSGETAQMLQVMESRTGTVVANLPLTDIKTGANDVLLPTLPAGLYLLRLQTDHGSNVIRFNYQP